MADNDGGDGGRPPAAHGPASWLGPKGERKPTGLQLGLGLLGLLLAFLVYRANRKSSSAASTAAGTDTTGSTGAYTYPSLGSGVASGGGGSGGSFDGTGFSDALAGLSGNVQNGFTTLGTQISAQQDEITALQNRPDGTTSVPAPARTTATMGPTASTTHHIGPGPKPFTGAVLTSKGWVHGVYVKNHGYVTPAKAAILTAKKPPAKPAPKPTSSKPAATVKTAKPAAPKTPAPAPPKKKPAPKVKAHPTVGTHSA